ncbi:hypothetical protein [Caulobacter vibrioides]
MAPIGPLAPRWRGSN